MPVHLTPCAWIPALYSCRPVTRGVACLTCTSSTWLATPSQHDRAKNQRRIVRDVDGRITRVQRLELDPDARRSSDTLDHIAMLRMASDDDSTSAHVLSEPDQNGVTRAKQRSHAVSSHGQRDMRCIRDLLGHFHEGRRSFIPELAPNASRD